MKDNDEMRCLISKPTANEFLNMYLQQRTQAVGAYTTQLRLPYYECGKNKGVRIVYSRSRSDYSKTKLWVFKPLYSTFLPEDYCIETVFRRLLSTMLWPFSSFDLQGASREVFCGRLAATIFGKDRAPDTRFNLKQRGVVSRIIGDDASKCLDMYHFASLFSANNRFSNLSDDAHSSLLDAILYNLITGNKDIHPRNMIVRFKSTGNDSHVGFMIYGIDYEYAFYNNGCLINLLRSFHNVTLKDILSDFYKFPCKILDDHLLPRISDGINKHYIMSRLSLKNWFVTKELYVESLRKIVNLIEANNFHVCRKTKDHICKKLKTPGSVYTRHEIENVIVPIFDDAISALKENVKIVQEFLLGLENGLSAESNLRPELKSC